MGEAVKLTREEIKQCSSRARAFLRVLQAVFESMPPSLREDLQAGKDSDGEIDVAIDGVRRLREEAMRVRDINARNKSRYEAMRTELIETRAERDRVLVELAHARGQETPDHLRHFKVVDDILASAMSGASDSKSEDHDG